MGKSIMIQGTMSNVGKSLLTAGLCRIFKQDGYKTAPFKSQNMALNSFITGEGLEMGRAQVMQAEAAGAEPSVLMNPILLKPTNDTGSQVIVNGKVLGTMSAREYFAYKKKLVPQVLRAYQELEEQNDVVVIEGAGSPAEINLKQEDLVNMGMARMANAPVLLAGDIDRGGVFAQLAGTLQLLAEEEKKFVKGLIINKFRGDKSILEPGVAMIEEITKVPAVGVVPYMQVDLEEEDSLTERFSRPGGQGPIQIAVIKLPRISNFTDFAVLECMEQVTLTYVSRVSQLGTPDMIILPGTKNTMSDLKWLRESGLEPAILRAKQRGCVIFGICGGYQMMGELLSDPEQVEEGGSIRGIGLLPVETVFTKRKTRTQVTGTFGKLTGALAGLSGMGLEGYEIHMGSTRYREAGGGELARLFIQAGANPAVMSPQEEPAVLPAQDEPEPAVMSAQEGPEPAVMFAQDEPEPACLPSQSGSKAVTSAGQRKPDGCQMDNAYGTYVHGVFDGEGIAAALVEILAERKGIALDKPETEDRFLYKEKQYDLLADTLRSHLDMKKIYEILEEGVTL